MSKEKTEDKTEQEQKPKGPPKTTIREYFESLVVTFVMALFGMTFIPVSYTHLTLPTILRV